MKTILKKVLTSKALFAYVVILALLAVSFGLAFKVRAAHLGCGAVLIANAELDSDLVCLGGTALIIGANGITVDLNGHTLTGDPAVAGSYGIDNTGGFDKITVKKGGIVGFEQGLRAVGTTGMTIKDLAFSGQTSSHAIDILDSSNVTIKDSTFALPTVFLGPEAIRLESVSGVTVKRVDVDGGFIGVNFACGVCDGSEAPTNGVVKQSTFLNTFTGVLIANSTDATVKQNKISEGDSLLCGFCGPAVIPARGVHISFQPNSGTKISDNEIFDNVGIGIRAAPGLGVTSLSVKSNKVHDNTLEGILLNDTDSSKISGNEVKDNGADGLALLAGSTGNSIKKNVATGNTGFDMSHDGGSTPNTWKGNVCGTSSGADIDCP